MNKATGSERRLRLRIYPNRTEKNTITISDSRPSAQSAVFRPITGSVSSDHVMIRVVRSPRLIICRMLLRQRRRTRSYQGSGGGGADFIFDFGCIMAPEGGTTQLSSGQL